VHSHSFIPFWGTKCCTPNAFFPVGNSANTSELTAFQPYVVVNELKPLDTSSDNRPTLCSSTLVSLVVRERYHPFFITHRRPAMFFPLTLLRIYLQHGWSLLFTERTQYAWIDRFNGAG